MTAISLTDLNSAPPYVIGFLSFALVCGLVYVFYKFGYICREKDLHWWHGKRSDKKVFGGMQRKFYYE